MPTADELTTQLNVLFRQLNERATEYQRQESYYTGACPLPQAIVQARVTKAYRMLMPMAEAPWGSRVVDSVQDRLEVAGIRSPDDQRAVDEVLWGVWQDNQMDAESKLAHNAALIGGRAYSLVQPIAGKSPEISLDTPEQMIVQYRPGSRKHRLAALRRWKDENEREFATLYRPEGVYKFAKSEHGTAGGQRIKIAEEWWQPRDEMWFATNPLGVVPVVELAVNRRLKPGSFGYARGEYEHCNGLIDRINLLTFLGLVVAFWQGFPLRAVTGQKISWEFLKDDDGNPLLDSSGAERKRARPPFDALADTVAQLEDPNAKLTEFGAADRKNLSVIEELDQLATITGTPRHYFPMQNGMSNLPLALDTVVPTPNGRKTMGDLILGDKVFTPEGTAQTVIGLSPIFKNKACYRMRFDDATEIVASADHKWQTSHFINPRVPYSAGNQRAGVKGEMRKTAVVTTEQIAASLKTSMGTYNHYIPVATAHEAPDRAYLIDPYALGAWLGDGSRAHATVTSHADDATGTADRLRACGEVVRVRADIRASHANTRTLSIVKDVTACVYGHPRPAGTKANPAVCSTCAHLGYLSRRDGTPMPPRRNESFVGRLRSLGVLGVKHIPEIYFAGSPQQRLALLQGLMDTDGTVSRVQGSVAITLHDERLARDTHRLAQSLGMKVNLRERTYKSNGRGVVSARTGKCWRMCWSACLPVFRMERKLRLQRTDFGGGDGGSNRPLRRYITSCERVPTVPVRCITVSSASMLFCVTDAFIATHNSADAIRASEGSLAAKVVGHKGTLGEGHEETLRVCGLALPDPVYLSPRAELVWQDHEARSMAERADAAVKLKDILPRQVLWERYLNATQEDSARWEAMMMNDVLAQLMAQAVAAPQAPADDTVTPGEPVPTQ